MGELLHAGALVPAAVGACCTLGARRSGRAAAGVSAVVMLLAMLDTVFRMPGLPALVWAALLIGTALAAAVSARAGSRARAAGVGRAGSRARAAGVHPVMALHGGLGMIVMAGLLLVMGGAGELGGAGAPASAVSVSAVAASVSAGHHGGGASGALVALVGVGSLAYAGYSAVVALRLARGPAAAAHCAAMRRWLPVVEVAGMGASTVLMLLALAA
ncbi:hypothetical protein [Herbiconiux flava]|uniref:Uncharacterized protein n=1 Tax=Herbiconiux flava TaxID=881268 RepID=A0A852SKY3_9MICO|nr:hypothetical protein [Herbiconiux flava]NYD69221.1 hypothetical protein [Herbiconiux flava]